MARRGCLVCGRVSGGCSRGRRWSVGLGVGWWVSVGNGVVWTYRGICFGSIWVLLGG